MNSGDFYPTAESASTDPTNLAPRFEIVERECESEIRQRQFANKYGVTLSDRHACVNRLVGKHCGIGNLKCADPCPNIPDGDHLSLWNKDGIPFVIVSQPYGLTWSALEETVRFCNSYGLRAEIGTWPSWHSPGSVLTVLYFRRLTQTLAELSTTPAPNDRPALKLHPSWQPPMVATCNYTRQLDLLIGSLNRVDRHLEIVSRALINGVGR